ncbi:MAG: hypothetical protein HC910_01240 [Spirulinaceae cyanobacterium SM2_1_0]|nr:hypothetical protein [Spirulinaceae cyanobacterium SM2_1_0]
MSLIRLCALVILGWLLADAVAATPTARQVTATGAIAQLPTESAALPRLSPFEVAVLREIDRARTNPNAYADWLERQRRYFDGNVLRLPRQAPIQTQEGMAALDDAIRFLRQARPILPLSRVAGLSLGLNDLLAAAPNNPTALSDTNDFIRRLGRYGEVSGPVSLSLSASRATARSLVMQMVLDDGNPDRDRRATLFNINYRAAGTACRPDPNRLGQQICLLAYAGDYTDDDSLLANLPPVPTPPPVVMPSPVVPTPSPVPSPVASPPPTPPVAVAPPSPTSWLFVEQGVLEDGDTVFQQDGTLYDEHMFRGTAGTTIVVRLESTEFDTFLAIFDEQGELIEQNDDTDEEDSNSTITLVLPYTGIYRIFVNGYNPGDRGRYTLTIR